MSPIDPNTPALGQSLARLRDELARRSSLDDELKRQLGEVLGDIERALQRSQPPAARPAAQSRLESLAIEFEAEHPALAASVREFVDLLGRAGL